MAFADWLSRQRSAFGYDQGTGQHGTGYVGYGKSQKHGGSWGQGGNNRMGYGLHAGRRAMDFMQAQAGPGGYLADDAVNPLMAGITQAAIPVERQRREDLGYNLASSGVNPTMAGRIQSDQQNQFMEQIGLQQTMAGEQIRQRQYGAGQELLNVLQGEEDTLKVRQEMRDQREEDRRHADRAARFNMYSGLAGLGLGMMGGPMGIMGMMGGMGGGGFGAPPAAGTPGAGAMGSPPLPEWMYGQPQQYQGSGPPMPWQQYNYGQ